MLEIRTCLVCSGLDVSFARIQYQNLERVRTVQLGVLAPSEPWCESGTFAGSSPWRIPQSEVKDSPRESMRSVYPLGVWHGHILIQFCSGEFHCEGFCRGLVSNDSCNGVCSSSAKFLGCCWNRIRSLNCRSVLCSWASRGNKSVAR